MSQASKKESVPEVHTVFAAILVYCLVRHAPIAGDGYRKAREIYSKTASALYQRIGAMT